MFESSNKGRGGFKIANLTIKAHGGYGDGEHFINGLSSVYFIDLNADGYKDLVICAAKEISGEKDEFWGYHPFFESYIYFPEHERFYRTAGVFDPLVIMGDYYFQMEVEQRIILDEKYRYNTSETSDKAKIDIDNDSVPDLLIYSLKKDFNNIFYCTIEMRLSKTNSSYFFSSKRR